MKIYIAGKITGNPNYREHFARVEKQLTSGGHLCMNPAILPEGFSWVDYMSICYKMIDACEAICLLDNWEESKGARLELEYAERTNKIVLLELKGKEVQKCD